ncbi:AEC family transporter [Biomaibacter acetigenes]|uniref:AEC family transporter n=1 Tax=Biomaibacter acetigenes TaxID=2316383 RepID=A0A3G2R5S2_9FIRM|nr:AEC family transporter [Biomaibacter acetigenes]AYO30904.1 AEC family transporter [Biomaibacter acetigenes]
MAILQSAQSIFSIMLMIFLGYVLTSWKWFDENSSKLLVNLVVKISLPLLMIHDLMNNFDREKLLTSAGGLVVPFTSIALCYLLSFVVSEMAKIQTGRQGVFRSMFFNSNTIFMGLPINLALFGEKSIPYVLLYYIANTVYFWTLGVYEINRDGNDRPQKLFCLETVKQILSPPLVSFLLAVVMIMLGIRLPSFIMDTFRYLGNLTTPISMLFIGITIHSIDLKTIRITKDMLVLFAGRFVISPLSILLLTMVFPLPPLMRNVFVIQAAMPVMTNTAIVSKAYGADSEYVAVMITATTIATIFVVPIYMAILKLV